MRVGIPGTYEEGESYGSAAPGDTDYLLRKLDVTPCRFRAKPDVSEIADTKEAAIAAYVRDHPGALLHEMNRSVPYLQQFSYIIARNIVCSMVDKGILAVDGQVPLEQVDLRYERVPACDVCGADSTRHRIVFWKYNTPVVRCGQCGLLYSNPRWKAEHLLARYTQQYAEDYAEQITHVRRTPRAPLGRRGWDPYLDLLEIARENGRLLDVGCSTGEFLAATNARGWSTYGVETSPRAVAYAEEGQSAHIHVGTLDMAPFADGWFDVVTLWEFGEPPQSPKVLVEQIARLVRPGGIFFWATPNIRSLSYRVWGRDWWAITPNERLHYFAPRTISRLLIGAGFRIHWMQAIGNPLDDSLLWGKYPRLLRLAPLLRKASKPLVNRLLLGDELCVLARRMET